MLTLEQFKLRHAAIRYLRTNVFPDYIPPYVALLTSVNTWETLTGPLGPYPSFATPEEVTEEVLDMFGSDLVFRPLFNGAWGVYQLPLTLGGDLDLLFVVPAPGPGDNGLPSISYPTRTATV